MPVTKDEFLLTFPEWEKLACDRHDWLEQNLADADLLIDDSVFGDQANLAIRYKAAQLMARSPVGRKNGLSQEDGSTIYDGFILELEQSLGISVVVADNTPCPGVLPRW